MRRATTRIVTRSRLVGLRTPLPSKRNSSSTKTETRAPVVIDYQELLSDIPSAKLSSQIAEAYGADALGLCVVKGVPGYLEKRERLLPLGYKFATLPQEVKRKYEVDKSGYGVGWVHGKETFKGVTDWLKGSFKANPQFNVPEPDLAKQKAFPNYAHPNVWPTAELPALEQAYMQLGQLMVSVGARLGLHCDNFVASKLPKDKRPKYGLHRVITESKTCKGRLLHYFPKTQDLADRDWCGWHNDHGSLTSLTSAMFFDDKGNAIKNPDPEAGLYIAPRGNKKDVLIKVNIPADHIAYQIGECSQILSGGLLQATPHMVKGPSSATGSKGISRTTFAVFMQPNIDVPLDIPKHSSIDAAKVVESNDFVPPLNERWREGQDFKEFTKQTIAKYHARDA